MKNKIDLSIIIVSFNTYKLIDNCLDSIYKSLKLSKLNYEVIVIDNNSQDGSVELIKNKYPQVKLIINETNLGFGKANNQGVSISQGQYLLFLNSDIEVLNQAIDRLYNFVIFKKDDAIFGGKLFNNDMTPQPSCGPEYSLFNITLALFFKGDYLNLTRYSPLKTKQVDWIMGACMMMAKKLFTTVGGFDEKIFMYMEEIDFEYRAIKLGFKIIFFPDAHFIHLGAASGQGRNKAILNVFKGFKYFYGKHHSYWKRMLLDILLISKSLSAIIIFTVLLNKTKQQLYINALKIALNS